MDAINNIRWLPPLRDIEDAKNGSHINFRGVDGFNAEEAKEILDSLLQNKKLETLVMDRNKYFSSSESCRALGELIRTSTTLKSVALFEVGMCGDGLKHIVEGILNNPQSALQALDLGWNEELGLHHVDVNTVTDEVGEGAEQRTNLLNSLESWRALGKLVRTTTTLKHLCLQNVRMPEEGLKCIVEGILENSQSPLETLLLGFNEHLGGGTTTHDDTAVGEGTKQLTDLMCSNTLALATLDLGLILFSTGEMKRIAMALASNTTLINLTVDCGMDTKSSWKIIWDLLKSNKSLQKLQLRSSKGLDDAFEDLMGMFRVNYTIKEIGFYQQSLVGNRRSQVEEMLLRNRRLGEYINTLQENLTFVKPSIGRLFIVRLSLCRYFSWLNIS